jgi:glycerophosphoryl diester phosphodiesterase
MNTKPGFSSDREARLLAANPQSVLQTAAGKRVEVKVHRCLWSGDYPENSFEAIRECYTERVAHAEIDLQMLFDGDFIVLHDEVIDTSTTGSGRVHDLTRSEASRLRLKLSGQAGSYRPPFLSDVAEYIAGQPFPTLLELDIPAFLPIPWPSVEELVRMVDPVRDRVMLNGTDWNMRRFLKIDSTLPVACGPEAYLDWVPDPVDPDDVWPENSERGAYGYFDRHPLAARRDSDVRDYLYDRMLGIHRLVPGARETHIRIDLLEKVIIDGFPEVIELLHDLGMTIDAWTLNADDHGRWLERLTSLVNAGIDMISSDTPRVLASAWAEANRD